MAKITFEYDEATDSLSINGGAGSTEFRSLGGRMDVDGFVVEARGGGVFQIAVPAAVEPVVQTSAEPDAAEAEKPAAKKKRK